METVSVDRRDGVVTITLQRPDKKNAMNVRMWRELTEIFDGLQDDPDARVLVITGAGDGFCSGADLTDADSGSAIQTGTGTSLRQMRMVGRCVAGGGQAPLPSSPRRTCSR